MANTDPDYVLNDRTKPGFIRVRVEIPNLKAKSRGFKKIIGGRKDQAQNASITCDFEERSFSLTVTGNEKLAGKMWTLAKQNLVFAINKDSSHWEIEDGFVNIFLKKGSNDDNWEPYLRNMQLEMNE